jgi:hypothetical protein
MIYLRNPYPKARHSWCALLIVILLGMQFLGYQHRIAHALSENGVFLTEASQELSQTSNNAHDCFQFPKIQHQCGAWDNAALGFGVLDSAIVINLIIATYFLKPFRFFHSPLPSFFSSYHSRAPPVIN